MTHATDHRFSFREGQPLGGSDWRNCHPSAPGQTPQLLRILEQMKYIAWIAATALLASIAQGQAFALPAAEAAQTPSCGAGAAQINALCFGAKGDNATDNVAAFRAWFNALAAHPGSIGVLPPGKYKVNTSVNGPPTLTGAKNVKVDATGAIIIQTRPVQPGGNPRQLHFPTIDIVRAYNLTWTGGRVIGKADYTGVLQWPPHAASDLEILDSNHVIVQNMRLDNWGYAGILLHNSNYIVIRNNQFVGPGSTTLYGGRGVIPPGGNYNLGIALEYTTATDPAQYNHDIEITGNSILYADTGIYSGDTYRNVLIAHNTINRTIGQHGMYIDGLTDSVVTDNLVVDPYYDGIKTNPNHAGSNILFQNNNVAIQTPGMGNGACLLVTQSDDGKTSRNSNVRVIGGTCSGMHGYGIYARVVDGLEIKGARISNIIGPGIVAYNVNDGTIEANYIDHTSQAAIIARPRRGVGIKIVGNIITDPNTAFTGNPILDSVISAEPWTIGHTARVDISGNRVNALTGSRSRYGIYTAYAMTGTATANRLMGLHSSNSLKKP